MRLSTLPLLYWVMLLQHCHAFSTTSHHGHLFRARAVVEQKIRPTAPQFSESVLSSSYSTSSEAGGDSTKTATALSPKEQKKAEIRKQARQEGGRFTIHTKFGSLNLFSIYYGLVSVFLGIPWFIGLNLCQFLYFITGNRFDRQRRLPVYLSHMWGINVLKLTRSYPKIQNLNILEKFYKENRPAMFVANHNSWMDIPFLGATVGWRNYKLVSKKELAKVPILGRSIKVGGHIMLDRSDRKSQLKTLKRGIDYLKSGVHLCTFPEGTRTRDNRLAKFKNGAFKMAVKAGAPIVPVSIVGAYNVMPPHWLLPYRPARNVCKVIVHEPVESAGKTEEELAEAVRQAMISGLPEEQRPKAA